MFGFGFCCCGGCNILGANNDATQAAFGAHYTLTDGAAEPVWNGNVPTFSGNTAAKVTAARAKYANDNVGFQIAPSGVYSELRYTFKFGAIEYQYIWNYEQDEGATVPVRFRLLKGASALFDSDEFPCYNLTAILNNTLAYIIRREDNAGNPRACFYVGNHLIDRQEQPETLELDIPVEVSYSINGTGYSLDAANGFTHLFKPDKFWLFPENLPASELPAGFPSDYVAGDALSRPANYDELPTAEKKKWDAVLAGEKEREGCAYPESCTSVWENSLPIVPPMKLTFSGWQDKRYIKSNTATNYADRVYRYSSLNDKHAAAGVATGCGFSTGGLRFSERVRSFWIAESSVTLTTTTLDLNGNPIESTDVLYTGSAMIYRSDRYIYKKDIGTDYESAAALVAAERTLTITDGDDATTVDVAGAFPYYNGTMAVSSPATFSAHIPKGVGIARTEWRDLIGAQMTPDAATAAAIAEHIGNGAKMVLAYDAATRINRDSSRPASVSVRLNIATGINPPTSVTVTADTWNGGVQGYAYTGSRRWVAACSALERQASIRSILDATVALDPVYQTDEDGNENSCVILYYANADAVTVNGWTIDAGALRYYQSDGSVTYDADSISGAISKPATAIGTAGALAIDNQHVATGEVQHTTAQGTSTFSTQVADDNDGTLTPCTLANIGVTAADIVYRARPAGAPDSADSVVYCAAHDAYELLGSARGDNLPCTPYVRTEALL